MIPRIILILCFLSITTFALSPTLSKNYFFVNPDNHLSHELYQTRNGIVSHSIESFENTDPISRYLLINLSTKDASPILSDIVKACEIAAPTFQHLHYHVQTDSLVYFCAANNSLLLIDQSSYTAQTVIPFNLQGSWPVARLSTDGMSVAILTMDNLFSLNPQASALFKVDMQTKKLTTQILLNQGYFARETAVAYVAGKTSAFIATNQIQYQYLTTSIYSIVITDNTYQLKQLKTFNLYIYPYKVITKLFSVGNYVVVNSGVDVYFIDQRGISTPVSQAKAKPIINYNDGLFQPAITAQFDSNTLYIQSFGDAVGKYSVSDTGAYQLKKLDGLYGDMQIAYGNSTFGDLAFTVDSSRAFFKVWDLQTFKNIYTAPAGYRDLMQTDTTYTVVQEVNSTNYRVFIFDLKTDALIAQVPMSTKQYYFNKDQQMITLLNATTHPSGCVFGHIDLVSGKVWTTLSFAASDPICSSFVVNARITKKGNPEVVLPFTDHYLIISEAYGQLTFKTTSSSPVDFDILNINFDDLSAYYLVSDQGTQQVNASLYAFDSKTKTFQLQKTNVINDTPVNKLGFFAVNSDTSVAISNNTFVVIEKLDSPISYTFPNNLNLATSFQDANGGQYVLVAYYNEITPKGSIPELYSTIGDFVSLPGMRMSTVSGRATGPKSFALHDDLYKTVGLIRFYNANSSKTTQGFFSKFRPQFF